jgi:hypothetical protein
MSSRSAHLLPGLRSRSVALAWLLRHEWTIKF